LVAKAAGTAGGMAAGRVLTALAGAAAGPLIGLLVRHRGVGAAGGGRGGPAGYPGSGAAAPPGVVGPWVVVFCLAGALLVFDGDEISGGRRLLLGGAAFGFAGAVEAWAIVPVLVICALCLPRVRRAARFVAGVALGFAVPVLPFALASPVRF